jgi:hypothetical protein
MSSHPPMEKPKLVPSADPPRDLVAAGRIHLGSAATLTDVPEALKLTVGQGKHVKHISSVPHRGHLSHPGPQTPRTR